MTFSSAHLRLRSVCVLGSTGSVGTQALDLISRNPDRFRVVALAAGGGQLDILAEQTLHFHPEVVALAKPDCADEFLRLVRDLAQRKGITSWPQPSVVCGPDACEQVAAHPCDVVLNAVTGAAGLSATMAALRAGRTLALANKESLIIGGELVTAQAAPGQIVPVDSEHSAIAQCLRGEQLADVQRLIVTASGGPFRGKHRDQLTEVTPAQALAHPTWQMGPVITINSATLMNKGLEVIEAHFLFGIDYDRIEVVVHPTSMVHSMVEFVDGSTMAQASPPDMKLPIALGLAWPHRVPGAVPACDWGRPSHWDFSPLDDEAFPALRIARWAGQLGGVAPAIMNAVNEECVAAFLDNNLPFLGIIDTVEQVLQSLTGQSSSGSSGGQNVDSGLTVADVVDADHQARLLARRMIAAR